MKAFARTRSAGRPVASLCLAWICTLMISATPALAQQEVQPGAEFEPYALPQAPASGAGGVDPSLFPPLGLPPGMGVQPMDPAGSTGGGFRPSPGSPAPPKEDTDGWIGEFPKIPTNVGGAATGGGGIDPSLLPPLQEAPKTDGGLRIPPPLIASGLTWHHNPYVAAKAARRSDRYLLLVFGGWDWNPQTEQLSWEVFATGEFKAYAKRWFEVGFLDYSRNPNQNHEKLNAFKTAYQIRGLPSAVIFSPEGDVVYRENGYRKGQPVLYLGRLQSAVSAAHEERMAERELLKERGFRTWTGLKGGTLFAKAFAISDAGVHLVDMGGQRYRVSPGNLSDEDLQVVVADSTLQQIPPVGEGGG